MKYNYIIISGYKNEYEEFAYSQLKTTNFACFTNQFPLPRSRFLKYIYRKSMYSHKLRFLFGGSIRRFWLKLRLSEIKRELYTSSKADKKAPVCFILYPSLIQFEDVNFFDMLRNSFPSRGRQSNKILFFFGDLVAKDHNKKKILSQYRNTVDMILTYDQGDAEQYGLVFHNYPYSDIKHIFTPPEPVYDVSFMGLAKNRMREIISAFEFFQENGITCNFHVVKAWEKDRAYSDIIHYYDSNISYGEYLNIMSEGSSILEIIQHGSRGNTFRLYEALSLGRRLITNNQAVKTNSLYYPEYMQVYEKPEQIDIHQLKDKTPVHYPENLKLEMSPISWLEFIEARL